VISLLVYGRMIQLSSQFFGIANYVDHYKSLMVIGEPTSFDNGKGAMWDNTRVFSNVIQDSCTS